MKPKALVTGSAGLVGSEAVRFLITKGYDVCGIDNDMRKIFFGNDASTSWMRDKLVAEFENYFHYDFDIRDEHILASIFKVNKFEIIIHAAAQPSHDWAAINPLMDFSINATATLKLLDCYATYCPGATFIYISTNKVYGDIPNHLSYLEFDTRYELIKQDSVDMISDGFNEYTPIDQCKHSLFGCSKLAGDLMVQEYGRYFGLNTGIFRAGCVTGPNHSGTQMHGFLSYLAKCIATGKEYTIYGYQGKQVRDAIHSYDLVHALWHYCQNPGTGRVFNMGGSRHSNSSILESIEKFEKLFNKKAVIKYNDTPRIGDHKWWISDISKFKHDYPEWDFKYNLDEILKEVALGLAQKGIV